MERFQVSQDRWLGDGEYPFIIAEIGNNHNGDLDLARRMIRVAKEIGVDAVKFQMKDIETAFSQELLDKPYLGRNSFGRTYREHKQALEFSEEQMNELYAYAGEQGIMAFCTPFDVLSVARLERIGNPVYKISSFHVTDLPLIEAVCRTGKPILMSTGMSTVAEIDAAMELIRRHTDTVALFHCVSAYPTEDQDVNMRVISYLKKRYSCPVGYSGHERGVVICLSSIPLGGCMIERHFTLDRTMKGPDHAASVEPSGMQLIVRRAKYIFNALGAEDKRMLECERDNRKKFRGY